MLASDEFAVEYTAVRNESSPYISTARLKRSAILGNDVGGIARESMM